MKLIAATEADIDRLMSWFPTKQSIDIWGGPNFRYPFTPDTFHEDVRWKEMGSYCLVDSRDDMLAFGQFYERHSRINLARLVVSPQQRGKGLGKQLVSLLLDRGPTSFPLKEFSLYVYEDNHPAMACYAGLGFAEHAYPDDDEMPDNCIYMTRPV